MFVQNFIKLNAAAHFWVIISTVFVDAEKQYSRRFCWQ